MIDGAGGARREKARGRGGGESRPDMKENYKSVKTLAVRRWRETHGGGGGGRGGGGGEGGSRAEQVTPERLSPVEATEAELDHL